MIATRAFRLGTLLTLALAAALGMSNASQAQATKTDTKTQAKEKAKGTATAKGLIDLNSATAEELQTLPGIGEVHSRKIIDSRPHKTLADLSSAGVNASTIEKIKPLVEVKPLPTPVDVNVDPIERLETLPGVGLVIAKEIVAARPHNGYDSIAKIKGIGPEKLDALKGRLKFGEMASARAKAKAKEEMPRTKAKVEEAKIDEAKAKDPVAPKLAPGSKVNINTASKEVLDALPGIGPVKAQAILDARKEKKFDSIEDIMRVRGIKEGEFGKIKDMITVK